MKRSRYAMATIGLLATAACATKPVMEPTETESLSGTSWQLVKFVGGDDTTRVPDDPGKYTIEFGADGSLTARVDCNRGRGTWKSGGAPQLEFSPLALTRAMCAEGSLHDFLVRQWPHVRSYVLKDGHLHLSLMADAGVFEFEPAR